MMWSAENVCPRWFFDSLVQGSIVWEEETQLRKFLFLFAYRQVCMAFSWLMIDLWGSSSLKVISPWKGGPE